MTNLNVFKWFSKKEKTVSRQKIVLKFDETSFVCGPWFDFGRCPIFLYSEIENKRFVTSDAIRDKYETIIRRMKYVK